MSARNLIEFELRPVEDRTQTLEKGHYASIDVEFVTITQFGGNHAVEKRVTPEQLHIWLNNPDLKYIYDIYIAWKTGLESPVIGFPLKQWPAASPAQIKNCAKLGIRAVEELAEIPDGKLNILGQGARAIRDKAREWLKVSANQGVVLEEISSLKTMMSDIIKRNTQLEEENKQLQSRLEEQSKKQ